MACLMVVGADPSNPMAGDLGFIVFEVAPGASFDTCDRANYPADPSDPSTWNAACQPGTAYMYGGSFDYTSDCAGNPVGGSECSVSNDVYMWRGLVLTTNQAHCAYAQHCEEMCVAVVPVPQRETLLAGIQCDPCGVCMSVVGVVTASFRARAASAAGPWAVARTCRRTMGTASWRAIPVTLTSARRTTRRREWR